MNGSKKLRFLPFGIPVFLALEVAYILSGCGSMILMAVITALLHINVCAVLLCHLAQDNAAEQTDEAVFAPSRITPVEN